MTDTTSLTDQITPLVRQLADILDRKRALEDQERDLKARLREMVPGPDTYAAGESSLVVTANTRFDPSKALPLIPEEVKSLVTYPETVVDKDKLRMLLPDVYAAAQTTGDYRLSVKPA